MKEYNLICCGCKTPYTSKWRPKNNVWYCNKSCANKHTHRRKLEGKCFTCGQVISSSRRYCPPCYIKYQDSRRNPNYKEKKKLYLRGAVKSYVRKLKEKAIEYKGGKCCLCGYSKYNGSLQFHHINESDKSFSISGKSMSFDRLKPELDKCILTCANCHGEIHGGLINRQLLLEKVVGSDGTSPSSQS